MVPNIQELRMHNPRTRRKPRHPRVCRGGGDIWFRNSTIDRSFAIRGIVLEKKEVPPILHKDMWRGIVYANVQFGWAEAGDSCFAVQAPRKRRVPRQHGGRESSRSGKRFASKNLQLWNPNVSSAWKR